MSQEKKKKKTLGEYNEIKLLCQRRTKKKKKKNF